MPMHCKRFSCQILVGVVLCLLIHGCATQKGFGKIYRDEFEGNRQPFWRSSNRLGDATDRCSFDSSIVRRGQYSYRFEVREGDYRASSDPEKGRERQEFYTPDIDRYGAEVWYAFSLYFPQSNLDNGVETVVGQWKQSEHGGGGLSPFLSFRVVDQHGYFALRPGTDNSQWKYWQLSRTNGGVSVARGMWHDFVVHFKTSKENDGYIQVWKNNNLEVDYRGRTVTRSLGSYFKCCLYRPTSPVTSVVYLDSFIRTENPQDLGDGNERFQLLENR